MIVSLPAPDMYKETAKPVEEIPKSVSVKEVTSEKKSHKKDKIKDSNAIGISGDDTDYSRAKRHKHFTIEPDKSTCWE